ncbi:MAG: stage IV sporulation protein A [Oscillospiraceae bacterium]|nr:stage IV sporulation protein A [Oscillospiraceae bacterium]
MDNTANLYRDIATRTGGDIYIGVVGPVRTGKSTFIKRFMETMVIPNIENPYARERARDELPQSGSGRVVMTSEPKFVPEEAVTVNADGAVFSVRLIDCVGFMAEGAICGGEDGEERMVSTPWFDREVSMTEAAETGTRRVIAEHSTLGIVMTTDGSIAGIPRSGYVRAEEQAVERLRQIGKPFIIVLNCADPLSAEAEALRGELAEKYDVSCVALSCLELSADDVKSVIRSVLMEFPVSELGLFLPSWIEALSAEHPLKSAVLSAVRDACADMRRLRDAETALRKIAACESISRAYVREIHADTGAVLAAAELPPELFYATVSERSGFAVKDDGDLLQLLTDMSGVKSRYDRVRDALDEVYRTGYGVVYPSPDELQLAEPEIVRRGGRYGVRLKASAPSIHMMLANVETEVSPALGSEKNSEDIINFLLQEFQGDTGRIWESNIFGKSLYDIAGEGLQAKLKNLPDETRGKLREAIQRIVNEGGGGLICIIL